MSMWCLSNRREAKLKIVLLGANGRTGREVLNRALSSGDTVTALVRAESRLADVSHTGLTIKVGDPCDTEVLKLILPGHDVLISTLGPRKPTKKACGIYSQSAAAIVEAMQGSDVSRLLVTSTALLFPSRKLSDRFFRWIARNNYREAGVMEEHICSTDLQWTFARTGFLTNNKSVKYSKAENSFPAGGGSISRAALASFLLEEARRPSHICQIVGLCG